MISVGTTTSCDENERLILQTYKCGQTIIFDRSESGRRMRKVLRPLFLAKTIFVGVLLLIILLLDVKENRHNSHNRK